MVLTQAHHTLTLNCLLKQNSVSLLLTQVQGQKEKWPLLNKMKPVPNPLRTSGHVEEMCNHILLGLPLLWEVDRIAKITMRGSKLVGQGGADQRTRRPMVLKWMASLRGKVLRSRKRSYHFTHLLSLTLASLTSKRQIQVDKPLASHEPTRYLPRHDFLLNHSRLPAIPRSLSDNHRMCAALRRCFYAHADHVLTSAPLSGTTWWRCRLISYNIECSY